MFVDCDAKRTHDVNATHRTPRAQEHKIERKGRQERSARRRPETLQPRASFLNSRFGTVCSSVRRCAGRALASTGGMITNDEMTDAFTEVLAAAGAEVCKSCGSRALVRTGGAAESDSGDAAAPDGSGERADRSVWFCFACGHEQTH